MQKKNFLALIKKLLHIWDYLVLNRGSVNGAIQTISSWVVCLKFNASLAYDFFKSKGHVKPWAKIVWNRALPPKFSFFFWLAVPDRVPTKNRNKVIFELYIPDSEHIISKIKIQVYKVLFALYPHILIYLARCLSQGLL
ncbi:hypothetical protein M9H77_07683 [Catharanthus roseus]|uniref:Uncharacterized protein n=1 Tax=Catharanthus roseus TaxID=4058 RepID=A0ACC0BVM7_CATRO|nr:hypothetical protein M9H77_07683 [Catharanthus roseus]